MSMEGDRARIKALVRGENSSRDQVDDALNTYSELFDEKKGGLEARKSNYARMVNHFYDLVTDFYEYGWGQSFHFAPRHKVESFEGSIHRHEMWLAHQLKLYPGMKAIDLGCGVGGPQRTIARFSGAHVVGLNNNDYQLTRAKKITADLNLSSLCSYVKGDFMNINEPENSYDAAYQIEATCHAPDKVKCYQQVFKVLKPGALFGGYEWVMTPKWDPNNEKHNKIKRGIEVGNGLPDLEPSSHIVESLKAAGFEVLEARDLALSTDLPWYLPLSANFSITGLFHTRVGRTFTHYLVAGLEKIKLAPRGSTEVSSLLRATAEDLVEGGKLGIFTPMFFVLARKPENAQ